MEVEILDALTKVKAESALALFLDSISGPKTQLYFLATSFHFYCHGIHFEDQAQNVVSIMGDMLQYESDEHSRAEEAEKIRIAEINNARFDIGDTLHVDLIVKEHNGVCKAGFRNFNFSDPYDTTRWPKPLGVDGVLLSKDYENTFEGYKDSTRLSFLVKILYLDQSDVMLPHKMYFPGDTFKLRVTAYGGLMAKGLKQ
ncbi:MAG: hypothetical protein AAFN10_26160 [Bacteroidota bacterium]